MEKEQYITPQMEVVEIVEDVIRTSSVSGGEGGFDPDDWEAE